MNKEIKIKNENGEEITISIVGNFKIEDLKKEYVIYSIVDDNPLNDKGAILIGELVRNNDELSVIGIDEEEQPIVLAFYNEIANSVGE